MKDILSCHRYRWELVYLKEAITLAKIKNILRRILLTAVAVLTVTGAMGISAVPVHAAAGDVTVTGNVTKATDEEIKAGDKIISITTPTSGITNDDAITYTIYKIFNASIATGGEEQPIQQLMVG